MAFHRLVYVNSDSLKAQSYSHKNGQMNYRQKITDEQRMKLLGLLMQTNWQQIEKRQVKDNGPDDYPDFDFTIHLHDRLFKYNVYLTKVEPLFELVNYLNTILPKQFSMDYTDQYFGNAK